MSNPNESAIRALRDAYNDAIVAHDARKVTACLMHDVQVTTGDGARLAGLDEVRARFEDFFRDASFVAFKRNASQIEIALDGKTAAEMGEWVGLWNTADGLRKSSGRYFAVWRKNGGRWQIQSECFVTLS